MDMSILLTVDLLFEDLIQTIIDRYHSHMINKNSARETSIATLAEQMYQK